MKKIAALVLAFVVFFGASSFAYEKDTHLRMIYIMARAAGIDDAVAKYLAYGSQHVDRTIITSAMLLSVQRGLFHFTGTPYTPDNGSEHGSLGILETIKNFIWTGKVSLAERNHAVGSMLIYMGLVRGDLQIVSAGLHVKQDTYGHAGFSSLFGHIFDGHNPDRAFLEQEKYEDMIRSLMRSLVKIRQALPPEHQDIDGAVKYLNKYAKSSNLQRDVVAADLDDAATVAGVVNSATDIKAIFGENMFKNYQYKMLALQQVYDNWHDAGGIAENVKFNDLFPDELLQNGDLDATDTIRTVLVSDLESGFLQNKDGVVLIDVEKIFGARSKDEFDKKLALDTRDYEVRLREYITKKKRFVQLEMTLAGNPGDTRAQKELTLIEGWLQRENIELSYGSNLDNLSEEIDAIYAAAIAAKQDDVNKAQATIIAKYKTEMDQIMQKLIAFDPANAMKALTPDATKSIGEYQSLSKRLFELTVRMNSEIKLAKADLVGEEYIIKRAKQLGELKAAAEIADQLTKDLIPRRNSQYVKQQFEGETRMRDFEVAHKDEAYRRYIAQNFGENWVLDETTILTRIHGAIASFKAVLKPEKAVANQKLQDELNTLVNDSVDNLLGTKAPPRADAKLLKWNMKSNLLWNVKMGAYVGPGLIPYVGDKYVRRVYIKAEASAKRHEFENIAEQIALGNYRILIPPGSHIESQVRAFACPAIFLNH